MRSCSWIPGFQPASPTRFHSPDHSFFFRSSNLPPSRNRTAVRWLFDLRPSIFDGCGCSVVPSAAPLPRCPAAHPPPHPPHPRHICLYLAPLAHRRRSPPSPRCVPAPKNILIMKLKSMYCSHPSLPLTPRRLVFTACHLALHPWPHPSFLDRTRPVVPDAILPINTPVTPPSSKTTPTMTFVHSPSHLPISVGLFARRTPAATQSSTTLFPPMSASSVLRPPEDIIPPLNSVKSHYTHPPLPSHRKGPP